MNVKEAHEFCNSNKETIQKSTLCSCFYCEEVFKASLIKEWVGDDGDDGDRALCPHCGIDSVLPDFISKDFLDKDFLARMYKYWFDDRTPL